MMMTRHSDTLAVVSPEISEQAHAAILLKVAARTVREARQAWRLVIPGDTASLRSAFRACVLAMQALHRAAAVRAHDAREYQRLTAKANRMAGAANDLKARLVRAQ